MSSSVISIGRVVPDGEAIARIRQDKELSQEALAQQAKISQRLLRDIERRNHPIPKHRLLNIATQLGTPTERIQLAQPAAVEPDTMLRPLPDTMLRLLPVEGALAMWEIARSADSLEWTLAVEPNSKTAPPMEAVLTILNRIVDGRTPFDCDYSNHDEFDRNNKFSDIARLSCLGELLQALTDGGICVLANTYLHHLEPRGSKLPPQKRIWVMFTPAGTTSRTVPIDSGYRPAMAADIDDDIPF